MPLARGELAALVLHRDLLLAAAELRLLAAGVEILDEAPACPVSSPCSVVGGRLRRLAAVIGRLPLVLAISVPSSSARASRRTPARPPDVLGREGQRELAAQELERVVERHVLLAVHRVVAEPHQHRALGGELGRPLVDGRIELVLRHDLVREPVLDRLLAAHPLAQQHHLVDLFARDVAVDDRHDHVGERADVDLRGAEGRAFLGDQQVAGERQAHARRRARGRWPRTATACRAAA